MSLAPGSKLGSYEIGGLIGSGGMGEVYRARDTKLDRDVALKILPGTVSTDPERLARFEREAKTLAALNHPHIAHVYDAGREGSVAFLVMEFVEGEDLSRAIARGALALSEALPIARQIADALEAAHEKGIIHRDLKPANVKVSPDGTAKVLDFGLAKALTPDSGSGTSDSQNSPTLTARATQLGLILGTAAYMAPEQARGKAVDKRADIWAFGVVLYEMVTGSRAFGGEEVTDVLARVLERDPDWSKVPASTPPALRRLLERCLAKDPKSRLRDIGEARLTLDELIAGRSGSQAIAAGIGTRAIAPSPAAGTFTRVLPWLVAAAFAGVAAFLYFRPSSTSKPNTLPVRVSVTLPDGVEFYTTPRISPDGRRVLFVGNREGVRQLFVRELSEPDVRPVPGTESCLNATFSADSKSVAVVTAEARLRRIGLDSGSVEDIAAGVDIVGGLNWTKNDRILFGQVTKIVSIPATGGTPKEIVSANTQAGEASIVGPVATPDGKMVLFTTWTGPPGAQQPRIEAVPADGGPRHVVIDPGAYVLAAFTDRLVFQRDQSIYVAPFDPVAAKVTGVPTKLSDEARFSPTGGLAAGISDTGDLVFADTKAFNGRLSWVSLDGVDRPIAVPLRSYNNPRVSPDGRMVAYSDASAIWTTDTERGAQTRIFSGTDALTGFPVWSADGTRLYFRSSSGVLSMRADGQGKPEEVKGSMRFDYPNSISPDGKTLLATRILAQTSGDIVAMPVDGASEIRTLVSTSAYEGGAQFSPDGKWMTYVSNSSSRMEVYVRQVDNPEKSRVAQVSTSGGIGALWSHDGHHIYFRNGAQFLTVDISTSPELRLGTPKVLFERRYSFGPNITIANYALSKDGREFLVANTSAGHLTLIFNALK